MLVSELLLRTTRIDVSNSRRFSLDYIYSRFCFSPDFIIIMGLSGFGFSLVTTLKGAHVDSQIKSMTDLGAAQRRGPCRHFCSSSSVLLRIQCLQFFGNFPYVSYQFFLMWVMQDVSVKQVTQLKDQLLQLGDDYWPSVCETTL